jgi:hypothetical protein
LYNEGSPLPTIGLTTPNGTLVTGLSASVSAGNLPTFTFPEAYSEPFSAAGYFAGFAGSYQNFDSSFFRVHDPLGVEIGFTVTNLTIGASAIPEPSTYAALFGLCALGLVMLRRRRAAA